jgi:hypothetical protein
MISTITLLAIFAIARPIENNTHALEFNSAFACPPDEEICGANTPRCCPIIDMVMGLFEDFNEINENMNDDGHSLLEEFPEDGALEALPEDVTVEAFPQDGALEAFPEDVAVEDKEIKDISTR